LIGAHDSETGNPLSPSKCHVLFCTAPKLSNMCLLGNVSLSFCRLLCIYELDRMLEFTENELFQVLKQVIFLVILFTYYLFIYFIYLIIYAK